LDTLAKHGVVFSRAYSHVPLTPPSHATLLTGTYPQFSQLEYMGQPLAKDIPYLPEIFHRRGYRTGAFVGSMILDPKNVTAVGFDRGFDTYNAGFHRRAVGEDRFRSVERRAGEVVERATGWLAKGGGRPFFLWIHCYDPHGPYEPPEPYKSRFAAEPYDGEIAYTDSAMGGLLKTLHARGLYDNSLIVVTADHGEAFGEHGERHHGVFLYDETIHVPLLIKLPKDRFAGKKIDVRVGLVDIAPTVLKGAGLAVSPAMQGESLVAMMTSPSAGATLADRSAYSETIYAHRAFGWSALRSWRTGKYLYIQAPRRELYDQTSDPSATHNLAADAKAVSDILASQLDEFHRRTSTTAGESANLTPEQAENLRALGYLSSNANAGKGADEGGADPKDKIEVANLLTQALFDAQDGRDEDAVPRLEQVLQLEQNTPVAYLELGKAYVRLKQYQKAVPVLKIAVEKLPDDGSAHFQLGRAMVETKDWAEAAPEFEAAIARTPKSAELHFYLAVVYERTQRIPDAIKEFKNTVALDPKHFRANLLLGRLFGMQGKAAEALPYLKTATKLDPESVEAHTFLANVYFMLGQESNSKHERELGERLQEKQTAQ
jgi:arylsulfatase A-like enzyme/Tfp pilus assembly protein PilF